MDYKPKLDVSDENLILMLLGDLFNTKNSFEKYDPLTVKRFSKIYRKLRYGDFCEKRGIEVDEMTNEDYEDWICEKYPYEREEDD